MAENRRINPPIHKPVTSPIPRLEEFCDDSHIQPQPASSPGQDSGCMCKHSGVADVGDITQSFDQLSNGLHEDNFSEVSGPGKGEQATDKGYVVRTGFPETAEQAGANANASWSGYPSSGHIEDSAVETSQLGVGLLTELMFPDIQQLYASFLQSHGTENVKDRPKVVAIHQKCFDLRGKPEGLYTSHTTLIALCEGKTLKSAAALQYQCDEESVVELQLSEPALGSSFGRDTALIIGFQSKDFHLIVTLEGMIRTCVLLRPDSSFQDLFHLCLDWLKKLHGPPQSHTDVSYCLLSKTKRLDSADLLVSENLERFEHVQMVKVEARTIKVVHRQTPRTEQVFYVDVFDTDYIGEIKEKFLQMYECETDQAVTASNLQLSLRNRLLSDDQLLRDVLSTFDFTTVDSSDIDTALMLSDSFYAHFLLDDIIFARVHCKSNRETKKNYVAISPKATFEDLHHEIAKIVHRDPFSFKVLINGKKLEADANLPQFLGGTECNIVVEPQKKVNLFVEARELTSDEVTIGGPAQTFQVSMYKHENISRLKSSVCRQLQVQPYCVSLQYKDNWLSEEASIRSAQLRAGHMVHALVQRNRVRMRVRLTSGRWEDIVVDDLAISTVGHLKAFASLQIQAQDATIHCSAILNGQVLNDFETLKKAGVQMNDRILLIHGERLCYTAVFGCVPVFLCAKEKVHRTMAMSNGKKFFFDPQMFDSLEEGAKTAFSEELLIKPDPQPPHPGLYLCTPDLRKQFPKGPAWKNRQSSAEGCDHIQRCHICRSVLQQAYIDKHGGDMVRSKSATPGDESVTVDTFQVEVSQRTTSTPVPKHSKSERSAASTSTPFCDTIDGGLPSCPQPSLQGPASEQNNLSADVSAQLAFNSISVGPTTCSSSSTPPRQDESLLSVSNPSLSLSSQPQASPQSNTSGQSSSLTDTNTETFQGTGPAAPSQHGVVQNANTPVQDRKSHLQLALLSNQDGPHDSKISGTRETYCRESITQSPDGSLVASKTTQTCVRYSPEFAKCFGQQNPFSSICGDTSLTSSLAVTFPSAAGDLAGEPFLQEGSIFKYIPRRVIQHIAKKLTKEYSQVIMDLGVDHRDLNEAEEHHRGDWYRISYQCLVKWCQKYGKDANIDNLKRALSDNERFDLVEDIEKMDGSETC